MTTTIGVNEAILCRGISGSARVTQHMIDAMGRLDGVSVRGSRPSWARSDNKLLNAFRDARWDFWDAARTLKDADLLLSPCNMGRARRGQKHLLMVYDVMLWDAKELFDPAFGAYARTLIPLSMRSAHLVLTISEHAKSSLSEMLPSARIMVVRPPGAPPDGRLATFPTGSPVVLVLGETAPHKNQVAAVRAVEETRRRTGIDVRLRVIGPPGLADAHVHAELVRADPSGAWSAREVGLTDIQLADALTSAWVLVQPSLHEGYGLPLVEAAQRGLPVVHSGREGMADILPLSGIGSVDPEAFADRLVQLLDRATWRAAADYGLERAPLFGAGQFDMSIADAVREVMG